MSEMLKTTMNRGGYFTRKCSMCPAMMADEKPIPEHPICCICEKELREALARMQTNGRIQ